MDTTGTADAPQHLRALERANQVRLARADLKKQVAEGALDAADVVLECPAAAERMELAELLRCQRRWGATRCRRFLQLLSLSETKHLGSLTQRQRRVLAEALRAGGNPLVAFDGGFGRGPAGLGPDAAAAFSRRPLAV